MYTLFLTLAAVIGAWYFGIGLRKSRPFFALGGGSALFLALFLSLDLFLFAPFIPVIVMLIYFVVGKWTDGEKA
ncbi:hypothetical protein ACFO4L_01450 [Bacillus daqingensis]|uniref:Uncharacterized protein n=1 Tax=Bacillus daqingensis TaxID=872396 RepID=A0ABV9NPH7_9BACI